MPAKVSPAPVGSRSSAGKAGQVRAAAGGVVVAGALGAVLHDDGADATGEELAGGGGLVGGAGEQEELGAARQEEVGEGEDALHGCADAGRGEDLLAEVRVEGDACRRGP